MGDFEQQLTAMDDDDLSAKTSEFRRRLSDGESDREVMPEAFAVIREASRRTCNHRHFDCQLVGGQVLYESKIAEMKTGEGKTIVCHLASYLKVLQGEKVHIVTVNDYLVQRDAEFARPIFEMLGVTVGFIQAHMESLGLDRRAAYDCDITYGTNSEFGFDYLRDNMKLSVGEQVQGPLDYTVVDEVDSILIDEARTPLIISGAAHDDVSRYKTSDKVARAVLKLQSQADRETRRRIDNLSETPDAKQRQAIEKFKLDSAWLTEDEASAIGHVQYFLVERDRKAAHLTHDGITAAQEEAGVGSFYVGGNMEWPHLVENAMRAHVVWEKDKDYVVQNGEVIIVDEFTGRLMHGRQWADGLHQSVEAKESVTVKKETQTMATITLQNFFKLYNRIAGMTGTAMTESSEFMKIYKLEVVAIPTNRPVNRSDHNDKIYGTETEKYDAIAEEINAIHSRGFPADPWLLSDLAAALVKVFRRMPPNGDLARDRIEEITGRLENALEVFDDGNGDESHLAPAYQQAMFGLPGGRPILVGTISIENSEKLSEALDRRHGIDHEVLNAKQHAREADIVAKAGFRQLSKRDKKTNLLGNVTIATNMAGRGTDIKLEKGVVYENCVGDLAPREPGVISTKCCIACDEYDARTNCAHCFKPKLDPRFPMLGRTMCPMAPPCGLHIVGTERHEARRIDNQLRGRSGRQGDPGSSRFFLSLEDDVLRLFMGDWTMKMMHRLGLKEGQSIEAKQLSKGVARAQRKVEERNFSIRKHLLEMDEVMDHQRQTFYQQRQAVLEGRQLTPMIWSMIDESAADAVNKYVGQDYAAVCIAEWAKSTFEVTLNPDDISGEPYEQLCDRIRQSAMDEAREQITSSIGEYIIDETDPSSMDHRGLAKWAMSRFGVNFTQNQLRRMPRAEIEEMLSEQAHKNIEQHDMTPLRKYFDPKFGGDSLDEWTRLKFGVQLDIEDHADIEPNDVEETLAEKVRTVYRRREIEYPIDFALEAFSELGGGDSAYSAEALVRWTNAKFNCGWELDDVRGKSLPQLRGELVDLAENFLDGGRLDKEIQLAIQENGHDGKLTDWAKKRFGVAIDPNRNGEPDSLAMQLATAGRELVRRELSDLERYVMLHIYDSAWIDHLLTMDHLKNSIGLRGYAEKDPKIEFKREGFRMFEEMIANVREKVTDVIFKARLTGNDRMTSQYGSLSASHEDSVNAGLAPGAGGDGGPDQPPPKQVTFRRNDPKVGPNDPCPCGSGKKYKKCHGQRGGSGPPQG
jgi:preprotein translocase subunit SecA